MQAKKPIKLNSKKSLAQLRASLERREQLGQQPVSISSFQSEQAFITGTKQWIIRADQAILRASRGVEKALRTYLIAKRQTRMIEILYDKEYVDYRKQLAKKEQKDLDDLMIMRARLKEAVL